MRAHRVRSTTGRRALDRAIAHSTRASAAAVPRPSHSHHTARKSQGSESEGVQGRSDAETHRRHVHRKQLPAQAFVVPWGRARTGSCPAAVPPPSAFPRRQIFFVQNKKWCTAPLALSAWWLWWLPSRPLPSIGSSRAQGEMTASRHDASPQCSITNSLSFGCPVLAHPDDDVLCACTAVGTS